MKQIQFYHCPICGMVMASIGKSNVSCCGQKLIPLTVQEEDDAHRMTVEPVEDEIFVSVDHPMEKAHSITFFALVSGDRAQIVHQYPEQEAQTRFRLAGHGVLYCGCSCHGLFRRKI